MSLCIYLVNIIDQPYGITKLGMTFLVFCAKPANFSWKWQFALFIFLYLANCFYLGA
jgi:hypothetical protein